jgi:hypothetical protein
MMLSVGKARRSTEPQPVPFRKELTAMKLRLLAALGLACGAAKSDASEFAAPVLLKANGVAIRVESPGYACPCWADMDGDGKKDLVVGQFRNGQMRVFKNLGDGRFAAGEWLKADGKAAEVPGVW